MQNNPEGLTKEDTLSIFLTHLVNNLLKDSLKDDLNEKINHYLTDMMNSFKIFLELF